MNRNPVETILGVLVVGVAAFFLLFAYNKADLKTVDGYKLTASFAKAGGLDVGTDIRISGIKVGTIIGRKLDAKTYLAKIEMNIRKDVALPVDTIANISSDGMLGGNYIRLEPGKSKEVLKEGDEITRTKDYKSLEDTVGEIIFLVTK